MAQLTNDCFAFGDDLLNPDEAISDIRARISAIVDYETVSLFDAVGRILAEDIITERPIPPYHNSAVDGYAIYHDQLDPDKPTKLAVGGRVAAGHPLGRTMLKQEAIRIFTGAPIPHGKEGQDDGPDTIMMQEDCIEENGYVTLLPGIKKGANLRKAGDDVDQGTSVLKSGCILRPQDVGMIAACGKNHVQVYRPLRVAIFSTGDEVAEPGTPLCDGALYDSNRFTIASALTKMGAQITDLGILEDNQADIESALREASMHHDLIISSGGMSVGEEDHIKPAVNALGSMNVWRLAIKPGRPIGMGVIRRTNDDGSRVPFIGLPGNPAAALTVFLVIARPIINLLRGADHQDPKLIKLPIQFSYKKKQGRREFARVSLQLNEDGTASLNKYGRSGAGVLSSLVGADGFAIFDEETVQAEPGDLVKFLNFHEVMS